MVLGQIFSPEMIAVNLESVDKDEVFEEMVEKFVSYEPTLNRSELLAAVNDREKKMSTGIISGIAVPHGKLANFTGIRGAVGLSKRGIDYDSLDQKPVHAVFMLISSLDNCEEHLQVLKLLAQVLEDRSFYRNIMSAKTEKEVYDTICSFEEEYSLLI